MTGFPGLIAALGVRRWILLKRYPVDTVGQLVTVVLLFVVLFLGGQSIVGPDLGGTLGAVVVGYFLWTMAVGAYSSLAQTIFVETQWGTFEQLYVAPRRFEVIAAAMAVVFLLETLLWGSLVLGFMLLVTGASLHVDPVTVALIGLLSLCSAIGVGFVMGGLALLYKRIASVLGLVQFALVGFIAAPVATYPSLHVAPLSTGSYLLRLSMDSGVLLTELPHDLLALLVVKAVVYVGGGLLGLRALVNVARRRGVVGHY
ncbi:ABC transporter permease [Natrononativus amylolyticus]|uniref:ABC transporter permease n=1 Tax=Natrononativus amylolyticus TaxID=2963434 RepID=UPI0020CEF62C|nr:ABC transporter permease [Natrononativus amylolyticus]